MAHPAAGNYSVSLAAIAWQPKPNLTIDFCGAVLFPPFYALCSHLFVFRSATRWTWAKPFQHASSGRKLICQKVHSVCWMWAKVGAGPMPRRAWGSLVSCMLFSQLLNPSLIIYLFIYYTRASLHDPFRRKWWLGKGAASPALTWV